MTVIADKDRQDLVDSACASTDLVEGGRIGEGDCISWSSQWRDGIVFACIIL